MSSKRKKLKVYQVRGEVRYADLHTVMNCTESLPDLIRFKITIPPSGKTFRYIDIVSTNLHGIKELYSKVSSFLIKDNSRI